MSKLIKTEKRSQDNYAERIVIIKTDTDANYTDKVQGLLSQEGRVKNVF